jgi:hypothetical protein
MVLAGVQEIRRQNFDSSPTLARYGKVPSDAGDGQKGFSVREVRLGRPNG